MTDDEDVSAQRNPMLSADLQSSASQGGVVTSPAPNHAQYRIWVSHCLFKKNGFPSLGTFGASEGTVVIMTTATWKRLCHDVPQLQTTQFEVGSQE